MTTAITIFRAGPPTAAPSSTTRGRASRRIGHALGSVRARRTAAATRAVGWRSGLQPRRAPHRDVPHADDRAELMTYALDDGRIERIASGPLGCTCESPRWSPDDRWIAFTPAASGDSTNTFTSCRPRRTRTGDHRPCVGDPRPFLAARQQRVVYSSSAGGTVPYPSTFNLRRVGRDGSDDDR